MPLLAPATALTYRPYLNRHRVIYVLHANAAQSEEVVAAFTEQGFMASSASSIDALARLIELHRPDVVLIDLSTLSHDPNLVGTLRSLAFGVRVFALADSNPLMLSALSDLFERDPRFSLVATLNAADSFLEMAARLPTTIGVVDWALPPLGGERLLEGLRGRPNAPRMLVYGPEGDMDLVRRAMSAGAWPAARAVPFTLPIQTAISPCV